MSNFKFTYKSTLTCVWLVYFTCNLYFVQSVEIECIPLKSCPTLLKLIAINKNAPETVEFLKNSHCGFDRKGQPKVWCSQLNFCKTPDNINGTCIPIKKCKPFLQLKANLDTSNVLTETYLNQYRCNTILKKIHVCCPHEKLTLMPDYLDYEESTKVETPNSFASAGIPDMRDRFGDSDYEDGNAYGWLTVQPEYYHHQDHVVTEFWNVNNMHGHEEGWGMPKHTHDHGFEYGPERWNIHGNIGGFGHQDPDFVYDTHRDIPDSGVAFNNNNKPRDVARGTPHHLSPHNVLNFNNKRGIDESHINRGTTEEDSWHSSEYTTPKSTPKRKTRTTTTEQTIDSSRERGTAHTNRFEHTTRRSGWKPQKPPTPSGREEDSWDSSEYTTPKRRTRTTTEQTTISNQEHGTVRADHTTRRSGWKPQKPTTPSGREEDSSEYTTRRSSWKPRKQTTSSSREDSTTPEDHTIRRGWKTEEQTTSSSRTRSTTKKYGFENTTQGSRRRPQQTTRSDRDEGRIIFEDSSESGTDRNWSTPEQTTVRNDQNDRRNCETPEIKAGICTKQSNCQAYLKLQNNLDKSKKSIRDYLNKFRCNSTNTREIYVCCQKDEEEDIDNSLLNAERTNENVPEPYSKICGRQTANTDRIFGGTNANLGEFPWIALLQYPSDKGLMSGCGGTLINSRYVLTAAHCVDKEILKKRRLQPLRQVILGEYDTRNETDCIYMKYGQDCAPPPKKYGVDSIVSHNLYSSDTTRHDIALIRLNQEVTFTDYIKPICLPTKTSTLNGNETFVISGWGRTPTEMSSPVLKKAKVPFAQKQNCNAWNTNNRALIDGQICVGRGNGTDSCSGDSGGPLMLEVNFNFEFVSHLVGIISYGFGECGTAPSVNTYVPYYIDWINQNIR